MEIMKFVDTKVVVSAKTGASATMKRGQLLRLTDIEGQQPIDFWAFSKENPSEHLSCEHTKTSIQRLYPRQGDSAYTNYRRPIVTLLEDNSPGQHDMESAACDQARYKELGVTESHPNCQDNLHLELKKLGVELKGVFQPWNLFTNFQLHADGTFTFEAPSTKAGDNIILRIELDCYIVISACPQDITDTCAGNPTHILMETGA